MSKEEHIELARKAREYINTWPKWKQESFKVKYKIKEQQIVKIYIASSWKMEDTCKTLAKYLRKHGFEVDCFCDESSDRYVFRWTELVDKEEDLQNYDAISFLSDTRTQRAFKEDKVWLDWADALILVLPSGRSAHLEAGYAKGRGKQVYIWGEFPKGEFDVMYGFANGLYRLVDLNQMVRELKEQA